MIKSRVSIPGVNNHGTLLNINWQSTKVSLYGTKEWKGNAIDSE